MTDKVVSINPGVPLLLYSSTRYASPCVTMIITTGHSCCLLAYAGLIHDVFVTAALFRAMVHAWDQNDFQAYIYYASDSGADVDVAIV